MNIIAGMMRLSKILTSMKTLSSRIAQLALSGLNTISSKLNNDIFRFVTVFCATLVSDYIWARYIFNIAEEHALAAANWSVIVIVLGAFIVLSYVSDRRLIVPAAIGAWIGTYLAV